MFYESPVFPDYMAYGLHVGPAFQTTVVRVQSGAESRNSTWEFDLRSFDGSTTHRTPRERNIITAFFLAMRGRLHGFRILDVSDYTVEAAEGRLELITSGSYQLMKRYSFDVLTYDRPIYKPRQTITVNGGGTYSVNYASGVVTHSGGSAPTSWVGQFDVPARFDHDELQWEVAAPHGNDKLYIANQLRILETRDIA